jgi:ubiquinone/menaquinone biosynthesis C-methylase UbiE
METEEAERIFDEFAEAYRDWWGPIIAPAAVQVLDDIEVPAGDPRPFELLDVGSGTGVLALTALERWPGVRVVAIDSSGRMLDLATEAAGRRSPAFPARLRAVTAGAEQMPIGDGSVDVAVSSFVVQLVPNRAGALREVRRVLRPGGRFALVTWHADDPPFKPDEAFADALDDLQIVTPSNDRDVHPFTSARAAAAELRRAGFGEVRARDVQLEHRFTPESYLDLLEHWIDRELFAGLDAETRAELRALTLQYMRSLRPDAFLWRRPLVRAVGRRPRR